MELPDGAFQRLNYFHGQKLDVRDFEAEQEYLIHRRRLHHRVFHSPGVVRGLLGDLRVSPLGKGDLSLLVEPGIAVDGRGEDLLVPERAIIRIDPDRHRLPGTIHVVLRRIEEPAEFLEDPDHPEYKGHRRTRETAVVEVIDHPPRREVEVELARVKLLPEVAEIRPPRDPDAPVPGELDTRFVPQASSVVHLPPDVTRSLRDLLDLLRSLPVTEVRLAAHSALLALAPPPRIAALVEALRFLFLVLEEGMGPLRSLPATDEACILAASAGLTEILPDLESFIQAHSAGATFPLTPEEVAGRGDGPPPVLEVAGRVHRLVDSIDIGDRASEEAHDFTPQDCQDTWPLRSTFTYPDGVTVSDRGRVLLGGAARFTVRNVTPGRDLLILRRMDVLRSEGVAQVTVDGRGTPGRWLGSNGDRRHRWRNGMLRIPPEAVTGSVLEVRIGDRASPRGIDMYRLWFYQPDTCVIMSHNGWGSARRRSP